MFKLNLKYVLVSWITSEMCYSTYMKASIICQVENLGFIKRSPYITVKSFIRILSLFPLKLLKLTSLFKYTLHVTQIQNEEVTASLHGRVQGFCFLFCYWMASFSRLGLVKLLSNQNPFLYINCVST